MMVIDAIFPATCAACGARGRAVCDDCARVLLPAPSAPSPPFVDDWFALYAYEGVARELVARIKYRNARVVLPWFANEIASRAQKRWRAIDLVTWPPTTRARQRERGFDHARLLARAVAGRLRVPARALVARATNDAQTGRAYAARRVGPSFTASSCASTTVLLVDDVTTTGATLRAAASALRGAGVQRVVAATIARTPPPGSRRDRRAYTAPR
jgi:predicted amidophosphoribosyltransferase